MVDLKEKCKMKPRSWVEQGLNTVDCADEWIRTVDLWCLKVPLYQLSHNHCPFVAKTAAHPLKLSKSNNDNLLGREPWSSGYWRWLMFERSWVRILAQYTGWTWQFFTSICCKNWLFEKTENKQKERPGWPIYKKITTTPSYSYLKYSLWL